MREITTHMVDGKGAGQDDTQIFVEDLPGQGGACHKYVVTTKGPAANMMLEDGSAVQALLRISFQDGPIQEVGINGVQQEHLAAVMIDRLEGFQGGKYANELNAKALASFREGLGYLQQRTRDRIARGVEGHNKA